MTNSYAYRSRADNVDEAKASGRHSGVLRTSKNYRLCPDERRWPGVLPALASCCQVETNLLPNINDYSKDAGNLLVKKCELPHFERLVTNSNL